MSEGPSIDGRDLVVEGEGEHLVLEAGVTQRRVLIPPGRWRYDDGTVHFLISCPLVGTLPAKVSLVIDPRGLCFESSALGLGSWLSKAGRHRRSTALTPLVGSRTTPLADPAAGHQAYRPGNGSDNVCLPAVEPRGLEVDMSIRSGADHRTVV